MKLLLNSCLELVPILGAQGLALMASGSTRSVFNLSFAMDNNIADITAKSTSQWIFSSLIGTAAGDEVRSVHPKMFKYLLRGIQCELM
jgi:hypothetical protein